MNKNYLWFLSANLSDYEGKYIAIADERVVSSGNDPKEVYEEAKSKYPGKEVILWKVPEGESFISCCHCLGADRARSFTPR